MRLSHQAAARRIPVTAGLVLLVAVTLPAGLAAAAETPQATVSASGVTLHSVKVELPDDEAPFPGGAAAEAINNNCLTCHSAAMVLNQPALPQATWQAEVAKMRTAYKAPLAVEDLSAIEAYLVATKGAK
jgi:hypothetical protein